MDDEEEINILGTNPLLVDTDGNGTSDGDEDSDLDGFTNAEEILCDYDPGIPSTKCSRPYSLLMIL